MNTTNILLATTSILIVVAFGLSFGGFSKNRDTPGNKEEFALLKQEMETLAAERKAFELAELRSAMQTPAPLITDQPAPLPIEPGTATTPLADEEREKLEAEIAKLQADKERAEKETEEVYEERNKIKAEQEIAAKRIKMALTMGTVVSASKENGVLFFKPSPSSPNHQPGRLLSVRRNSGVLGQIKIERLAEDGHYIADILPQVFAPDGYPDIIPGDEIIIDPNK